MRIGKDVSWMAAPLLVLVLAMAGCCDDTKPLGVKEGGAGGPAVVVLGTTTTFGVLAGTAVTNTGTTTITGDLGVSPGTTVTGSPTVSGSTHSNDATAVAAQADLTTAFNDVAARSTNVVDIAADIGGSTLAPGLYLASGALAVTGTLTLNALGDQNAMFIIRTPSTLTVAPGSRVVLENGAKAANVIWLVGTSASIGANAVFEGTILANQDITLDTGAHVTGRLLAQTGTVTLNNDVITVP